MAKIVLENGTDGARTKIISRLKSELTKAFLCVSASTPTLGDSLSNLNIQNISSDTTGRTRNLLFTSSTTVFQASNTLPQNIDDNILLFYLLSGRPVNKIVLGKQDGVFFIVGAYITIPTLNPPILNTAHLIREIKIEVLDQA